MATLPYMQLYVSDYLIDTVHLSLEEHGAYLLLIMHYWQQGKPLCDDDKKLAAVCSVPVEQWLNIRLEVSDFFTIKDGFWYHKRIEEDLLMVRKKSKQASMAGKASAVKRFKNKQVSNGRSTIEDKREKIKDKRINNIPFKEIISLLNKKTGSDYKSTTKATQLHIQARWNEGFRLGAFEIVIEKKTDQWKDDVKMCKFLRPETLFGTKFESYLNERNKPKSEYE